jgi:hypothetical protein
MISPGARGRREGLDILASSERPSKRQADQKAEASPSAFYFADA